MSLLAGPWDLPHHPLRPLLLFRGLYALLAFDAWALMLQHGGRYGVGSFNVAHFDLLDRLFPVPGPALYLGLVAAAGFCSFAGALGLLDRFGALALWALYTLAWMLSMHDSYQHHYLLSWLLTFAVFAPPLRVRDCLSPDLRTRESSFPLVTIGCGLVYVFTAISKSSPLWSSGVVMRKLAADGGPLMLPALVLARLGVPEAKAWHFAALSVLLLQLVIALGFFAASARDACAGAKRTLLDGLCALGLVFASAFHLSTELTPSFAIGWFSFYMLWTAWISLVPARWLRPLATTIEWLRARIAAIPIAPSWTSAAALISMASSLLFSCYEELPGLGVAAVAFASLWLLSAQRYAPWFGSRARPRASTEPRQRFIANLVPALGVVALVCTLFLANVRFDYYRRAAGELSRMGWDEAALDLYRQAERHAPRGESRALKIRELEQKLRER